MTINERIKELRALMKENNIDINQIEDSLRENENIKKLKPRIENYILNNEFTESKQIVENVSEISEKMEVTQGKLVMGLDIVSNMENLQVVSVVYNAILGDGANSMMFQNVREKAKKKEKVLKFDSKLADCFSKDRSKCEIYITEGDSASGNLKMARDNEFQAVMPVRGKILNTQKATLDKIQKNAEIMTMIDAFGLYIDKSTMKVSYDKSSLRYGKIIIMSDADVDGAHIKNLFYTFIWNFCPQLIQDGYIYAGVPPLYKLTIGKEYKYIKNDEELEAWKKANPGKSFILNRMKGLGEMDVDETEQTLTDPTKRIIKQITVEDVKAADKLFEDLMGTAIVPRKQFIKEHSKEATVQI